MSVVARAVKALAGEWSTVTDFTLPSEVDAGKDFRFSESGHLDKAYYGVPPNFALGFFYDSGPAPEVTVVIDSTTYRLTPGAGAIVYVPNTGPCTSLSMAGTVKGLSEGAYKFAALTGYMQGGVFYYDDRILKAVQVKAVIPPPVPPEIFGIPWYYIALVGGLLGIGIIGAVIYESERQKEMMMLMMAR